MPHVVTEPCYGCRNTICVTVCPVNCFHEDEKCLWIDPDECIDCGACVPECPTKAIFPAGRVPAKWKHYIGLNAEKSKLLPLITRQKTPLTGDGSA
jgi:ferredoxin